MNQEDVIRSLGKPQSGMTQAEALAAYVRMAQNVSPTVFGRRFGLTQKVRAIGSQLTADIFRLHFRESFLEKMGTGYRSMVARLPDNYIERHFEVRFHEYVCVALEYQPEANPLEWAANHGAQELTGALAHGFAEMPTDALMIWKRVSDRERTRLIVFWERPRLLG